MTYTAPAPFVGHNWTREYRRTRDIAADIRRAIKAAQKAGDIPADVKVSVRSSEFAGGRAIDVRLSGWDHDRVFSTVLTTASRHGQTPEALRVHDTVEAIRESWNRDASDAMVDYWDVDYYGSTTWDV